MQEIKDILAALIFFTFFPYVLWWAIIDLYRHYLRTKYEDPTVIEKAYNAPTNIYTYAREVEESKNKTRK